MMMEAFPELADLLDASDTDLSTAFEKRDSERVDSELASLVSLLDDPGQLKTTEIQRLLRRREEFVKLSIISERSRVTVKTGGTSGLHFLLHASRSTETPLFTLNGPRSGTLCPGDEESYPGMALLKVAASKSTCINAADRLTEAHESLSVTAWREVRLGPKHISGLSGNVRSPEKDSDYVDGDVLPKVSLVIFVPPASNKRPATSRDEMQAPNVDDMGSIKQEIAAMRLDQAAMRIQMQMPQQQVQLLTGKLEHVAVD